MKNVVTIDKIISLCKRRGFVFPGSEIYGGLANSWDYGSYGVELLNNIRNHWWDFFVSRRPDMVGIESTVIMNPKVWEASGHLIQFHDLMVEDKVTHERHRADHLLEEHGVKVEGMKPEQMWDAIKKDKIKSPSGNELAEPKQFNLMFRTFIGPTEDNSALTYLRPETAQGMFVDFQQVLQTTRKKIPFGIAQMGKCFRNEITTGQFLFRLREFNLMEFEYFIHPEKWEKLFDMWVTEIKKYHKELGFKEKDVIWHEIPDGERAHYSKRTIDIEYKFPFGTKELHAIAYRTDYDLRAHEKASGKDMSYVDSETGEKFIPHVIEPTFGADRTLLAVLCSAYQEEQAPTAAGGKEIRIVLKIPKHLAPIKVAVLPLSKKEELCQKAREVWDIVRPHFRSEYDETQSIGRRYRRQDEIGTPYCVTIDFETLNDNAVTIRDRDTMKQDRVKIEKLQDYLDSKLNKNRQ
ncbi:MAG: glycine--tRNA ligase [Candidatus Moranbacteria bacterium]|nr:glycine--tRNA ligase [Candidatus Moranbacteria bacterium]